MSFAIHKKFGTIKEIPKHAEGWINSEWVIFDGFPTKENYFESIDSLSDNHNPHARMRDLDLQFDKVIINGKKYEPNMMYLPYEWIVEQAFNNDREDYTVTFYYKKKLGAFNTKQGELNAGDYLICEDGLIINVRDTNKA